MLDCVCVYTQQCFSVEELNIISLRIKGNRVGSIKYIKVVLTWGFSLHYSCYTLLLGVIRLYHC